MFGCKSAPLLNCSIRALFSVARSVISGGYHRGSFEPVIKAIVRWLQMRLRFDFAQYVIDVGERFK